VRIPESTEKLDVIIPKATNILKFREERRDSSNREETYAEADPRETVAKEVFATVRAPPLRDEKEFRITDAQFASF